LVDNWPWLKTARVWEPCCGQGAIVHTLRSAGVEVNACSDIHVPDAGMLIDPSEVFRVDLRAAMAMPYSCDTLVTNPPFSQAPAMIRHAWTGLDRPPRAMALLLKATFFHAASRLQLFRDCQPTIILPLTWRLDFRRLGAPTMECSWFIWERTAGGQTPDTRYRPITRPTPEKA
jgi:hypothetical protein